LVDRFFGVKEATVRAKQLRIILSGFLISLSLLLLSSDLLRAEDRPSLPKLELPQFINPSTNTDTQVATAPVQLDGRPLFTVTAPSVKETAQKQSNTSPLQLRLQGIESQLNRLTNSNLNLETLRVEAAIDSTSNLPVISVNGQYLMTVTILDSQLAGQDPASRADKLTKTIKDALIQAQQERQPNFLRQQSVISVGILVGMFLSSWILQRLQRRLRIQLDRIKTEQTIDAATANPTQNRVFPSLAKQQQRSLKEIQRRGLQLAQVLIWGAGIIVVLGLFPYTRWLQPIALSTPLRLFSLVAITYLQIRVIDYLINRFFNAIEDETSYLPSASQRHTLRISTFSKVTKGLAKLIVLSLATLALLAMFGIDLVPLLAGAGIAGLGITFAFQSLLKDMINGCLILLEDQYAVGDMVQIATAQGPVQGLVEFMSLRITQLRTTEGRLITIPNNTIAVIENFSKLLPGQNHGS
jgi:moderate conductance mechanosensitive channel